MTTTKPLSLRNLFGIFAPNSIRRRIKNRRPSPSLAETVGSSHFLVTIIPIGHEVPAGSVLTVIPTLMPVDRAFFASQALRQDGSLKSDESPKLANSRQPLEIAAIRLTQLA